jgi:hypothetical protein
MLSGDSGGGSFFLGATLTALAGATSLFVVSLSSNVPPGSVGFGACEEADIVDLFVVAWRVARCQYFAVLVDAHGV